MKITWTNVDFDVSEIISCLFPIADDYLNEAPLITQSQFMASYTFLLNLYFNAMLSIRDTGGTDELSTRMGDLIAELGDDTQVLDNAFTAIMDKVQEMGDNPDAVLEIYLFNIEQTDVLYAIG